MMQLGVIGLGTMGAHLARNAARTGARVSVYNRTTETMHAFVAGYGSDGAIEGFASLESFVANLQRPRPVLLMVKAGEAVDAMITQLLPLLDEGDIIIDAGNSHYHDSARRSKELSARGIRFLGMGVSGGEEGALYGASMMPGGDRSAYDELEPLLKRMAADDGLGGACVAYLGPDGAGHFVKTVHNGIEYALMQILAESYHLLRAVGGASNADLARLYASWNAGGLQSFLMDITAQIFSVRDPDGDGELIDAIMDSAAQKGTGKWTTDAALGYGVAVPTITAAVDARIISSAKEFRVNQASHDPLFLTATDVPEALEEHVETAVRLSWCTAYAQGFQLLSVAGEEEHWDLHIPDIARIWLGGCIIRSSMLDAYRRVFSGEQEARATMRSWFDAAGQESWRRVAALGVMRAVPLPALASALSYYDAYRTARLPQNLTQAQRDFFGAHTFRRIDRDGPVHAHWHAT